MNNTNDTPNFWILLPEKGSRIAIDSPGLTVSAVGTECSRILFRADGDGVSVTVTPYTLETGLGPLPQHIAIPSHPHGFTLWWNKANTVNTATAREVWLWAITRGWRLSHLGMSCGMSVEAGVP